MTTLAQMRSDTESFLAQWGEALLRRRATTTYDDARRAVQSWSSSLSFTGDFQTLSGDEIRAESGFQQHSDYKVIAEYDVDVLPGDRIERGGDTFRVNYARVYEEHQSVFVYHEVDV